MQQVIFVVLLILSFTNECYLGTHLYYCYPRMVGFNLLQYFVPCDQNSQNDIILHDVFVVKFWGFCVKICKCCLLGNTQVSDNLVINMSFCTCSQFLRNSHLVAKTCCFLSHLSKSQSRAVLYKQWWFRIQNEISMSVEYIMVATYCKWVYYGTKML